MPNWKKVITSGSDGILNSLNLTSTGSGQTVLDIQGSQGQLFSITDDLTGDIFSISDISGVPIFNINASGATTFDGYVPDNSKLKFGNSGDLEIYHDGSHSRIKDAGTGNLVINASSFVLNNSADSKNMIIATDGGATSLYCDGSLKLATTSTGVAVTGQAAFTGDVQLLTSTGEYSLYGTANGQTALYNNGVKKFETGTTGVTITGNANFSGFVLDGNTITGIDDSSEFTNNDNHIMTSAAVEDKILGYNYNNYSLPAATSTVRGGVELFSNTVQSTSANSVTATSSRTYGVQVNSAAQMVVNVPWSDTNTDTNTQRAAGSGLTLSGNTLSHTDTSSQGSSNNSGRTYIQDITLDTYGHVTGLSTATETVVNTDTNTVDMGSGFVVQDGDGTNVTITENKYLKFKEGSGIDINFTDTNGGSSSDPFDITITNNRTNFAPMDDDGRILIDSTDGQITTDEEFTFDSSTLTTPALTIASPSAQNSEATSLMINSSGVVGKRELGSNAFTSTTIPTNNNQLSNGAGYITDGNTNWNNSYGFVTTSGNTVIGTDSDIDFDGAQVLETVTLTDGVIQGFTSRDLTLGNLGYTGVTNANRITNNTQIDNGRGYITSFTNTVDMGSGFIIEDGDGTEVRITENKEVKFVEGTGIDINWTDTSNGTDGDPYDLTITNTAPAGSTHLNSNTTKSDVGLSNVANESRATILGGNLTGKVNNVAVADVTSGAAAGKTANQDSTSTIRSGTTKANVGLGNVTNESKSTMFASAALTGNPTAPTQAANNNSTRIATTAYVQTEITDLIGGAPGALDTLNELAAAIGDDASYASSITSALSGKLSTTGKAADSEKVDGINGASLLRSDTADTFTGTLTMGTQNALVANNYGRGVFGLYSASRYQHVWSMGTAYNLADNGTTPGDMYGLAFTHTNNTQGQAKSGLSHQLLIMNNGVTKSAIGTGIWTSGLITTTSYGTSANWNTAYGWGDHSTEGYAKTKSDIGLGSVANESRATILGGNLTGKVNNVAVATVTAGAAAGATANQDSTSTIRSGTTKANVGLGSVDNKSSATIRGEITSANIPDNTASTTGNAATATLAANSTLAGGLAIGTGRNNTANQIVRTNGSGYADFGWINTTSGTASGTLARVYCSQDGYLRYLSPANFLSSIGVAAGANNYSLPAGSSSTRGGFKIGYTENSKNYPVEVSSEKMYVNVPWSNTNTQLSAAEVRESFSAGTNVAISDTGVISSTDTNTVYSHPTYNGDDFSVDTGALTGAEIVSDIDINVTTDGQGHVTDANGSVSTRTLTLANLGYTGATNANNFTYSLPAGSSSTRGGFKIGYTESGKNYPVEVSSEKMYVNVPWSDTNTNTTYSTNTAYGTSISGTQIRLNGGEIASGVNLNDMRTQGVFSQNSNADAVAGSNYPENKAGVLTVDDDMYGNGVHTHQMYAIYNSSNIYSRSYYNGSWTSWRNLAQDTNTQLSAAQVRANLSGTGLISYNNSSGVISTTANNYSLPTATSSTLGGVKVGSNLSISSGVLSSTNTITRIRINNASLTAGDFYFIDGTNCSFKAQGTNSYSIESTNTTYSADGNYGLTLSGTTFRLEDDRRRNSTTADIYTGNTHDFVFFDASHGMRFYTAGSEDMRLDNSGNLHVDADVVAFSTTVSDERLKDNVTTIENPLDKIKALRGVEYDWNSGNRKGKHDLGLIAQEVEKVLPNIVHEHEMPFLNDDEEDETLYKTVDYEKMVAVLIEGMKEQQNQIDSLKSELTEIKGKL